MVYGTPEFEAVLKTLIKGASHDKHDGKHSCYQECVDHAEEMGWHILGNKPVALLERNRPRESPEIKAYRLENFEPITKSEADKAIAILQKMFNPNLYSIRLREQTTSGKELWQYTMEDFPEHNSVVNFAKDVLLRKMLADPNGIIAIRPRDMPENDAQELLPIIKIFGSPNIWNFDDDHYLVFIRMEEEQMPQYTAKWYHFEYYDAAGYVSFKAYISPNNEQLYIEILEEYNYNLAQIPVWRLQGLVESLDDGQIMFKSFFHPAVPYWNDALNHESDLKGHYMNHIHPYRWEISENCDYRTSWNGMEVRCRGGVLRYGNERIEDCPECGGTGTRSVGPYGVMKIPKSKLDENIPGGLPIGWATAPTEATELLERRVEKKLQQAMRAINMDVEDKVGEVQSGVAKTIDRSAQYDMIYSVASVVFDVHLTNIFYFFNLFMNGVKDSSRGRNVEDNLPEVNKPTQFDLSTSNEVMSTIKVARESGADPNYLHVKQMEAASKDATTNPDLKKLSQLILDLDPLPGMDQMTINGNVMKGYNRKVDAVIHFNLKRFIERAIDEKKDAFLNVPREQQIKILEEYGNQVISETKPVVDEALKQSLAFAKPAFGK